MANEGATANGIIEQLMRIEQLGFDSAWMPGIPNGPDILTLLAIAGRSTERIESARRSCRRTLATLLPWQRRR